LAASLVGLVMYRANRYNRQT